jgi:integrase
MQGSIQKRVGKRGITWTVVVDAPPDPATGKRRQKRLAAATKKQLEDLLAAHIASMASGTYADASKLTIAEYVDRWIDSLGSTVRPQTSRRYADLLHQHAVPRLGGVQLAKLTPLHIQQLEADRLAAGLAANTVLMLHMVLHRALKQAMRWNLIARNVTEAVDPPRPGRSEYTTWSAAQAARFLAAAERDEYAALWRLAILTGMRRGELLGVKWEDLDLDRGTLAVQRTISRTATGNWGPGAPKTASGRRSVALQASAVEALRRHRTHQLEHRLAVGAFYQDQGYVFTTLDGRPLHINSLVARFDKLTKAAAVPRIRFHDLRHTAATLMLANGEHPKQVQERLGHSSIAITLDRYSHVTENMQRQAADRLEALLEKAAAEDSTPPAASDA